MHDPASPQPAHNLHPLFARNAPCRSLNWINVPPGNSNRRQATPFRPSSVVDCCLFAAILGQHTRPMERFGSTKRRITATVN